jgi:hypothetical protein
VKKIVGIICLAFAALIGFGIVKAQLGGAGGPVLSGDVAHDAGVLTAPIAFVFFGFWLLTHGDSTRPQSGVTRVITHIVLVLAIVMILGMAVVIATPLLRGSANRTGRPSDHFPIRSPSETGSRYPARNPGPASAGPQPPFVRPGEPGTGGTFAVGDKVEVVWAGHWRAGTVTELNGPTVFVRFDDSAMPPQIRIFTNQVRLKR